MNKDQLRIGLGTAAIGRPQYINLRQEPATFRGILPFRGKGEEVLEAAYRLGIRYFDTAPGYGIAEQMLIDWVSHRQLPDLEIASKWGYTYTAGFDPEAQVHEIKEHSLEKLNQQWAQSRKLIPHLSSYQIHSATFESGVLDNRPVLERLGQLRDEFGLRIGLSSSGENQAAVLERSLEIEVGGKALFEVFQVTFNLLDQSTAPVLDRIVAEGKRVVIKEALANGRLFPNPAYPHYAPLYAELERLAAKYRAGVDAVALRFCLDAGDFFMVLSGAATPQQLEENMKAAHFRLDAEELATLRRFEVPVEGYWRERKRLPWN